MNPRKLALRIAYIPVGLLLFAVLAISGGQNYAKAQESQIEAYQTLMAIKSLEGSPEAPIFWGSRTSTGGLVPFLNNADALDVRGHLLGTSSRAPGSLAYIETSQGFGIVDRLRRGQYVDFMIDDGEMSMANTIASASMFSEYCPRRKPRAFAYVTHIRGPYSLIRMTCGVGPDAK